MRVAVTGGSGLVGRRVVGHLAEEHDVINLDLTPPTEPDSDRVPAAAYRRTDILRISELHRALEGVDAVIHSAGLPGPSFGTDEEILNTNVEGTRNVALAAERAGVRRIVLISSEAVLGFVFSRGQVSPDYFPIDEKHRLAPRDVYGRSKLLAEAALARCLPDDSTAVILRPPWVWVPEEFERCRHLTESPDEWSDGLWAYVHGDDLARAAGLAATLPMEPGAHAIYVAAPDSGTVHPTGDLLRRYYPGVPVKGELGRFDGLISSGGAERLLGFRPTMSWRKFL